MFGNYSLRLPFASVRQRLDGDGIVLGYTRQTRFSSRRWTHFEFWAVHRDLVRRNKKKKKKAKTKKHSSRHFIVSALCNRYTVNNNDRQTDHVINLMQTQNYFIRILRFNCFRSVIAECPRARVNVCASVCSTLHDFGQQPPVMVVTSIWPVVAFKLNGKLEQQSVVRESHNINTRRNSCMRSTVIIMYVSLSPSSSISVYLSHDCFGHRNRSTAATIHIVRKINSNKCNFSHIWIVPTSTEKHSENLWFF